MRVSLAPSVGARGRGKTWASKRYGGTQVSQAKRLEELEQENAWLKKLLAESMLEKAILEEAASENY